MGGRRWRMLSYVTAGIVVGAGVTGGCGKVHGNSEPPPGDPYVCGPCYSPLLGDDTISGNPQLDGFFHAVLILTRAIDSIRVDFEGNVQALCALYGVDTSAGIGPTVAENLIAAIDADAGRATADGFAVRYRAPLCAADLGLAAEAQATCEAKADCAVSIEPARKGLRCEGVCTGRCDAACTGETARCVAPVDDVACNGECSGACQLASPAPCPGVCHGTCQGQCGGTCTGGDRDATGQCAGTCDGDCQGTCAGICELQDPTTCPGKCAGTCTTASGGAACADGAECHGSCDGTCDGHCTGLPTPPGSAENCAATKACQPQARAVGSVALDCTPPTIEISFEVNPSASGDAQATFLSNVAEVKRRAPSIVRDAVRLGLLVSGDPSRGVPSPFETLRAATASFESVEAIAPFDVVPGNVQCVVPAFVTSTRMLDDEKTGLSPTLEAQAKLLAYLTTGTP
ncbi:MAG TPA: hypothetical protein VHE30_09630 [Polyangiaceae bacterium]|nr:hypothetical protein [Polyangiaceae bacterium]